MDLVNVIGVRGTYPKGLTTFPQFSHPTTGALSVPGPITSVQVPAEEADKLLALSTADRDKFGAVLRAAWALFLRCYTGQDDVSFNFYGCGANTEEPVLYQFLLSDSAAIVSILDRAGEVLDDGPPTGINNVRDDKHLETAVVLRDSTKTATQCNAVEPVP